jgi:MFS family permease
LLTRLGRRYTIMIFASGILIFGLAASYAQSFETFLVLRLGIAFCTISTFTTTYVYVLEMVGGIWSVLLGIGLEFPWALGYSVLPAVAYAVPEWSWLQFTITIPLVLFIVATLVLPESPRWLLSQGRVEEAEDILDRAMEINGKGGFPSEVKLVPVS